MNDTLKGAVALTIMTAVLLLAAGIYFFTLYLAYLTSFGSLLLTLFPVLGQLYWLWIVWGTTGVFFNWFTIACLVWLGLVALSLAVLAKTSNRRAMISREALLDKDHDRFWASCGGDCGRLRPRAGVPVTPASMETWRAALGLAAAVTPPHKRDVTFLGTLLCPQTLWAS